MLIDRRTLINHLERIYIEGQINGVVFGRSLSVEAKTSDMRLVVVAPGLPLEQPFPRKFGILNLDQLIKFLRSGLVDIEEVPVELKRLDKQERFNVTHGREGRLSLMCSDTRVIPSRLDKQEVDAVKNFLKDSVKNSVELPISVVDGVLKAYPVVNPEAVIIKITGKKATMLVGDYDTNLIDLGLTLPRKSKEDYAVRVNAEQLTAVFKQISPAEENKLILTGPHPTVIGVQAGEYKYGLSSMKPEEEEE